jgi:hypothetical protein
MVTPALFGAIAQTHGIDVAWRWLAALQVAGTLPALLASSSVVRFFKRGEASD